MRPRRLHRDGCTVGTTTMNNARSVVLVVSVCGSQCGGEWGGGWKTYWERTY